MGSKDNVSNRASAPALLTIEQVAQMLTVCTKTVRDWSKAWEARGAIHPGLPSSLDNGLRRIRVSIRRYAYDPRDVEEYVENTARAASGLPPLSWHHPRTRSTRTGKE